MHIKMEWIFLCLNVRYRNFDLLLFIPSFYLNKKTSAKTVIQHTYQYYGVKYF